MRHPVCRIGGCRHIAALHLVKPLCACLDLCQSAFNGKFDGLIIAGLEMQAGDIQIGPPVAAKQRICADKIQRPADNRAIQFTHDQQHLVGHGGMQIVKHLAGQIGPAPFAIDGRQVEAIEIINMRCGNIITGQPQQPDPGRIHRAALFTDILALAR